MWLLLSIMLLSDAPLELLKARAFWGQASAEHLISFCQFTTPDPAQPENPDRTRYDAQPHHRLLADKLQAIESGELKRLLVVMPRRHGKTETAVRRFVPWYMGRHPEHPLLIASYNDTHAQEHGRAVRDVMQSPAYKLAFPKPAQQLRTDSQASDRLQTEAGGIIGFVGRGGAITGRGCYGFIIDDPLKDAEEAQSALIRDKLWEWYHTVVNNSFNTGDGWLVLIQTRWHADDLAGRLTDKNNDHYDPAEAAKWHVLHLPALAEPGDVLGRPIDAALWEHRLPASIYLAKRNSPDITVRQSFSTMDQGHPAPESGIYFQRDWLKGYQPGDLPKYLNRYCVSDHAVKKTQTSDRQCILPFGVDADGVAWILADGLFWEKSDTLELTEAMLKAMQIHKPISWVAGKDHISGSIGPFLKKRMRETKTFASITEVTEGADIQQRAQAIKGRMSMGMVRFPTWHPRWPDMQREILTFPNGDHDDVVACLAHIGRILNRLTEAELPQPAIETQPKTNTLEWVKRSSAEREERERQLIAANNW